MADGGLRQFISYSLKLVRCDNGSTNNAISAQISKTLCAILPISDEKLISTANVSTFLSPFARPILKLAHNSPGAILVGM